MKTIFNIKNDLINILRCPDCDSSSLIVININYKCDTCNLIFPISNSVPILINHNNELFPINIKFQINQL